MENRKIRFIMSMIIFKSGDKVCCVNNTLSSENPHPKLKLNTVYTLGAVFGTYVEIKELKLYFDACRFRFADDISLKRVSRKLKIEKLGLNE